MSEKWIVNIVATIILVLLVLASYGCRQKQVSDCRDGGGSPITRSWLSGDFYKVTCIEGKGVAA